MPDNGVAHRTAHRETDARELLFRRLGDVGNEQRSAAPAASSHGPLEVRSGGESMASW